jgi:hypothetical protein
MIGILRAVILVVLGLLALTLVIAIAGSGTGPAEKVVLGVLAAGVLALAIPVRRLGRGSSA